MAFRYELRLSGEGGQGLVLAGKILAEAAAIYDDHNATQSQSYGPEARGGASKSEVIISDGEIDFPKAENLDMLLALTQEAVENIVALGLIVKLMKVVSEEAAEQAILARVPKGTEDLNLRAFRLGLDVAEQAMSE